MAEADHDMLMDDVELQLVPVVIEHAVLACQWTLG